MALVNRMRATFETVSDVAGQPLTIRDVGLGISVTNDVEDVVARLVADGRLPVGRRLFYFDSDGRLDEIVVERGEFSRFAPAQEGHP